ncbi:MAG: methionyl-tRNA formyltransferase [Solirubrobacterales bacterium]|nr:methionyl-tRNA formyltransferase [Solirubrobacterales bacterium]
MKTAYLGTSEFAATVLRALAASEHAPALVITPPDRRKGRGQVAGPPPGALAARELDLSVHQTADVNEPDSLAAIEAAGAEAIVVCAFGQIIKAPLLDAPGGILNVHPSLLPRWRGAAPIERAIMAGDERTGTSIMKLEEGLDSGPVALTEEVPIGPGDYFDDLSERLAEASGRLLVRALDLRTADDLAFDDQNEGLATYAEKITAEDRRLDPARDAAQLAWAVRGLNPHIGTHVELQGGERLGVRRGRAVEGAPPQGRIERDEAEGVLVLGTASAGLALEVVQPPGKKPMSAAEFMRGYPVPERVI